MKKSLLLLLTLLSTQLFSQEHWEDNFWRKQTQERYKKTYNMAGLYTEFYDNGQIKWQGKCLPTGVPDSTWVYYDANGNKIWEGEYNGKYIEYVRIYPSYEYENEDAADSDDEDGRTINSRPEKKKRIVPDTLITGHYLEGLKEGEWKMYNYNGSYLSRIGHYHKGEPTGVWQDFSEETVVTKVRKTSEYDYSTQTQTTYSADSAITKHLDSLDYSLFHQIVLRNRDWNSSDPVSFNFCLAATAQMINLDRLNNFFYQPGHSKLDGMIQSVGLEWSGVSERVYWAYDIKWTPANSAQLNDSIRLRLSGWNSTINVGGDMIKSDVVDLCPSAGIGFQQLRLKTLKITGADTSAYSFREGDFRVYKRNAITGDLALNLRINMGNASLNIMGGYLFDLSSQRWRYSGKYLDDSPRTSLSGSFAGISFGLHIPDY